jgi:hypothetical protein
MRVNTVSEIIGEHKFSQAGACTTTDDPSAVYIVYNIWYSTDAINHQGADTFMYVYLLQFETPDEVSSQIILVAQRFIYTSSTTAVFQ